MNGSLAQAIALVTYGNVFLRTGEIDPRFFPTNSTFTYCASVSFIEINNIPIINLKSEHIFAINPNEWFIRLKHEGCIRLSLHYLHSRKLLEDHQNAGFVGGGGHWLICTWNKTESHYWNDEWGRAKELSPEKNGWAVRYINYLKKKETPIATPGLFETKLALASALDRVIEFADRNKLSDWKSIFAAAKAELYEKEPGEHKYYSDMVPPGEGNQEARRLLLAAAKSNHFGGMGSWNDQGFDSEEEYKKFGAVSAALYDAMCHAFVAGVNRFYSE